MATSLITCCCGAKNRLTLGGLKPKKFACGKCKHEFTPRELMTAVVERPVAPPFLGDEDEDFDLEPTDDIEWECPRARAAGTARRRTQTRTPITA